MTDLERIRRDLVACRDIPWACSCVEPEQLAALVEEVERLRERIADFEDDFRKVTSGTCAPDELHCSCVPHLRSEVERLRAENAELELGVATMRARMAKAYEQRNDERAAVVAWLRKAAADHETELKAPMHAEGMAWLRGGCAAIYDALYIIERGEHRREEEK